jgi:CBS-domain-containing membrane protein
VLEAKEHPARTVADAMIEPVALAYPEEILRAVADRMAQHPIGVLPVVARRDTGELLGLVTQFDLLGARQRLLEEERRAERVLTLRRTSGETCDESGDKTVLRADGRTLDGAGGLGAFPARRRANGLARDAHTTT